MAKTLIGKKSSRSTGFASGTLKSCESLLNKYGIDFNSYFPGTLNIELPLRFATPNWKSVLHIHSYEIDEIYSRKLDNGNTYRECWELIPVKSINGVPIKGFIYRTTLNFHGDDVIELLTEDLTKKGISIEIGADFEIVLDDGN